MKKFLISATAILAFTSVAFAEETAEEGADMHHEEPHVTDIDFSFEGPFGYYDEFQLQRGLQVYNEVCSSCHSLKFVGFYSLDDEGGPALPEAQARAFAQQYMVWDEKLREEREATYADHFPDRVESTPPAPDLSLMAKARAGFHGPANLGINQLIKGIGGPEYIYSILTGFTGETKEEAGSTFYENKSFSGGWISMTPPLSDGQITYQDGSPETVDQYSQDVAAFLMWAAEPKLNSRNTYGLVWFIMLGVIFISLWFANKLLWYPIKHPKDAENGSNGKKN